MNTMVRRIAKASCALDGIYWMIYERHTLLSALLVRLGVDEETAVSDACKMEHDISDTTFEAIKRHVKEYAQEEISVGSRKSPY